MPGYIPAIRKKRDAFCVKNIFLWSQNIRLFGGGVSGFMEIIVQDFISWESLYFLSYVKEHLGIHFLNIIPENTGAETGPLKHSTYGT
jgi:hypothetical protein